MHSFIRPSSFSDSSSSFSINNNPHQQYIPCHYSLNFNSSKLNGLLSTCVISTESLMCLSYQEECLWIASRPTNNNNKNNNNNHFNETKVYKLLLDVPIPNHLQVKFPEFHKYLPLRYNPFVRSAYDRKSYGIPLLSPYFHAQVYIKSAYSPIPTHTFTPSRHWNRETIQRNPEVCGFNPNYIFFIDVDNSSECNAEMDEMQSANDIPGTYMSFETFKKMTQVKYIKDETEIDVSSLSRLQHAVRYGMYLAFVQARHAEWDLSKVKCDPEYEIEIPLFMFAVEEHNFDILYTVLRTASVFASFHYHFVLEQQQQTKVKPLTVLKNVDKFMMQANLTLQELHTHVRAELSTRTPLFFPLHSSNEYSAILTMCVERFHTLFHISICETSYVIYPSTISSSYSPSELFSKRTFPSNVYSIDAYFSGLEQNKDVTQQHQYISCQTHLQPVLELNEGNSEHITDDDDDDELDGLLLLSSATNSPELDSLSSASSISSISSISPPPPSFNTTNNNSTTSSPSCSPPTLLLLHSTYETFTSSSLFARSPSSDYRRNHKRKLDVVNPNPYVENQKIHANRRLFA